MLLWQHGQFYTPARSRASSQPVIRGTSQQLPRNDISIKGLSTLLTSPPKSIDAETIRQRNRFLELAESRFDKQEKRFCNRAIILLALASPLAASF